MGQAIYAKEFPFDVGVGHRNEKWGERISKNDGIGFVDSAESTSRHPTFSVCERPSDEDAPHNMLYTAFAIIELGLGY